MKNNSYKKKLQKIKATVLLMLLFTVNSQKAEGYNEDILNIYKVDEPLYANQLNDLLYDLPDGIRRYLMLKNLNVTLLQDDYGADKMWLTLYGFSLPSTIIGFTYIDEYTDDATIYVEASMHSGYYERYSYISHDYTKEEFNYMLARNNMFHELGHFFDFKENFALSDSYEFNDIYNREYYNYCETTHYKVDNLGCNANANTPVEYFASTFSCYINYPDELKEKCPLTYEYINNYMTRLNEQYMSKEKVLENNMTR